MRQLTLAKVSFLTVGKKSPDIATVPYSAQKLTSSDILLSLTQFTPVTLLNQSLAQYIGKCHFFWSNRK